MLSMTTSQYKGKLGRCTLSVGKILRECQLNSSNILSTHLKESVVFVSVRHPLVRHLPHTYLDTSGRVVF